MRRMLATIAVSFGLLAAPVPVISDADAAETESCPGCEALLDLAMAHPSRKDDRARDQFRHPGETIAFFRIRPDMKVAEYAPGGGWYSRLLGVYLGGQGRLTGLYFDTTLAPMNDEAKAGLRAAAAGYAKKVSDWTGQPIERFSGFTLDAVPEAEKGTFDRIVIMRMVHNTHRFVMVHHDLTAMRGLLKDGGMLGIEQHRARPDAPYAYGDGNKGYMREKDVIALVEAHGFQLVAKSEINANRRDPANHPQGVWTLPPNLNGVAETDKPRLVAIGESDRMTLLFRKRP